MSLFRSKITLQILYGMLGHGIFFALLSMKREVVFSPHLEHQTSAPVHIQFHKKPEEKSAVGTTQRKKPTQRRSSPDSKESLAIESDLFLANLTYGSLIPLAWKGEIGLRSEPNPEKSLLPDVHSFKTGSTGLVRQQLMRDASILSGLLDIPLLARRNQEHAETFIRIIVLPDNTLRIIELRGQPILRAVIFEALRLPETKALLRRMLADLKENSLPIVLQIGPPLDSNIQDEQDFTWQGRKLTIRKRASPLVSTPLFLPDEAARQAKRRDLAEFNRLQKSPAYVSNLHNFDVGT